MVSLPASDVTLHTTTLTFWQAKCFAGATILVESYNQYICEMRLTLVVPMHYYWLHPHIQ